MFIPVRMKMVFAALIVLAVTACGSSSTAPTPMTVNATIQAGGYTPNTINISTGSTVMWTNQDSAPHTIVADGGAFASGGIAPGAQYSYTFPAAGTFNYHDAANANMRGTVNVSGSSSGGRY